MTDLNETLAMSDFDEGAFESQEEQDLVQMVGFYLGDVLYGVDILMVQEIIKEISVTAIPDTPDFIDGVINLRGRIIPVINLSNRLGLPRPGAGVLEESWTLILNIGERVTGFTVDRVTRVMKIPASAIEPPSDTASGALDMQYVRGACQLDTQSMVILDFNRILVVDELKRLAEKKRQQG